MSVSQSSVVRGPNPNAPPIPRRGDFGRGSSGGTIVPDNILRAREQVRIAENRRRTPVARRTGSNLASQELIELSQSAEDKFRAGVLRDAGDRSRIRNEERNRISSFQNRSGRLTSSAIARERARLEDARNHGQRLTQELLITALAKRRFGSGLPDLTDASSEEDVKQYLSDRYGGEANSRAQANLFSNLVGDLPLPRKPPSLAGRPVMGTRINQPQPEPEPEPERIPDGGFTFATPFSSGLS
tara:strand:- start:593 stop:1321 length:729 start_codon:yes stop_codon:yes gene_type:complete